MRVQEWIGSGAGRQARAALVAQLAKTDELTEQDVRQLDALRVRQLQQEKPELPKADSRVNPIVIVE